MEPRMRDSHAANVRSADSRTLSARAQGRKEPCQERETDVSSEKVIRILIADDHPIVREGIAAIIERRPDMQIVGEVSDGREAIAAYARLRPDVTLMDLRMPEMGGTEAIAEIRRQDPNAQIIVLTTYDTDENIFRGLRAGARAFLLKDAPRDRLMDAIRAVASGQTDIPPAIAAKLATRMSSPELTRRESEVLQLMAAGKSNLEIGNALCISEGTVKSHVNSILSKMAVSDRTQAVTQAIKRGLVVLK
jgi:two-component system, NarL family, response regulator